MSEDGVTERSQTVQVELERGLRDYGGGCSDIPTRLYTYMTSRQTDDLYRLRWLLKSSSHRYTQQVVVLTSWF